MKDGSHKEFVKCQTFKPMHKVRNKPPYRYIEEKPNVTRNPFQRVTTIDCDKAFCINDVIVSEELLTKNRRNICTDLFNQVQSSTQFTGFLKEKLPNSSLLSLNRKMSVVISAEKAQRELG